MRYNFSKVQLVGVGKTKSGKKRQKTFYQTLNPYNLNESGECKTAKEINVELKAEIEKWKNEIAKKD